MTLIVSNEDVEQVLTMDIALAALEEMYVDLGNGQAVSGPRVDILSGSSSHGAAQYGLKAMGGVMPRHGVGAMRLNSDIITWPERDGNHRREKVPAANGRWVGLVLLFSAHTGEPLMIFPDGFIQRTRVAATNAIGAKYLAREDTRVVGLLGSGWQAEGQLEALCAVRPIELIRVYSPNPEHREAFAQRLSQKLSREVIAVATADEAVRQADLIAAATNTLEPVIRPEWIRPGVHLSVIKVQEVDAETIEESDRVLFHTRAMIKEQIYRPGAERNPIKQAEEGWWTAPDAPFWSRLADLSDVASGHATGRQRDDEATLFVNNVGLGLQFAAVGARVYEAVRDQRLGHEVPTEWFTETVHP
ncbi:MAG: Ornithine cyclodeaminase [Chloroflexi bacterium]|nr:Ornithine cyclodeaminase [Chloroflexota bacterium]